MQQNEKQKEQVIEPEILDEQGQVINRPEDHARPKGDTGGFFSGLVVLSFGFLVSLLVLIFSVCVLLPILFIGRILGIKARPSPRQ